MRRFTGCPGTYQYSGILDSGTSNWTFVIRFRNIIGYGRQPSSRFSVIFCRMSDFKGTRDSNPFHVSRTASSFTIQTTNERYEIYWEYRIIWSTWYGSNHRIMDRTRSTGTGTSIINLLSIINHHHTYTRYQVSCVNERREKVDRNITNYYCSNFSIISMKNEYLST